MKPLSIPLAALVVLAAGCAAKQPTDTFQPTLDEAARSMKDKDAAALHAMLGEKLTVGTSIESLSMELENNAKEYGSLAEMVAEPTSVIFEAKVTLEGGQTLDLVEEQGVWKLATPVIKPTNPTDPVAVLAMFAEHLLDLAKAMKKSDVLAGHHDEGFLSMLETLAAELVSVRTQDLVLSEDRCYVDLPSGTKVELVRENEGWKVYSVFPAIEFR
jgi:hypothetical protein